MHNARLYMSPMKVLFLQLDHTLVEGPHENQWCMQNLTEKAVVPFLLPPPPLNPSNFLRGCGTH